MISDNSEVPQLNTFGNAFRISIFGESHGAYIGCTLDGLPAGFVPDWDLVHFDLRRRMPNKGAHSTDRRETDDFEIISGLYNDAFTGAPLTVLFKNRDCQSEFYLELIARPSHADYTAYVKYDGYNDPRGGGMFSGRLTAPIVFAGSVARQILLKQSIRIFSHVYRIGGISDEPFDPMLTMEQILYLDMKFPLVDESKRSGIEKLFADAKLRGTSLGGTVECAVLGLPIGIGDPFFDSVESALSHMLFSIPAVHGVEFGAGFGFAEMDGVTANDRVLSGGKTETNFSGGVNGGITNGMPLIFRTCFRPVPTVRAQQTTINIETDAEVSFQGNERHDVCILPRGCVIVECAAAIALLDLLMR